MPLKEQDTRTYTYRDYLTWHADERWELMSGRAVYMGPAPSDAHQRVLGELFRQIANALVDRGCQARVAPYDVRWDAEAHQEEARTVVQPDIVVVCDPDKLDSRGCKGAADLIIEVVSSASTGRDYISKLRLYEQFGVREYWIVHPIGRVVVAYRLGQTGTYAEPTFYAAETAEDSSPGQVDSAAIENLRINLNYI